MTGRLITLERRVAAMMGASGSYLSNGDPSSPGTNYSLPISIGLGSAWVKGVTCGSLATFYDPSITSPYITALENVPAFNWAYQAFPTGGYTILSPVAFDKWDVWNRNLKYVQDISRLCQVDYQSTLYSATFYSDPEFIQVTGSSGYHQYYKSYSEVVVTNGLIASTVETGRRYYRTGVSVNTSGVEPNAPHPQYYTAWIAQDVTPGQMFTVSAFPGFAGIARISREFLNVKNPNTNDYLSDGFATILGNSEVAYGYINGFPRVVYVPSGRSYLATTFDQRFFTFISGLTNPLTDAQISRSKLYNFWP